MPQINWPVTVIMVSIVMTAGVLGATHVLSADWIERTLTAVLGFTAGTAFGIKFGSRSPQ